ncbi:hypothetical protein ACOSQ4_002551 [Xanthoceras sorbifolium]
MVRSISLLACKTCIFILLLCFYLPFSFARDNITLNHSISDGETIISIGQIFELGFFTPGNGSNNDPRRYVGIWYKSDPETIVWVANRNSPLNKKNGVFGIGEDGNIAIFDEHKSPVWKANVSVPPKGMVKLLDSGNLQILSNPLEVIWESFKHPTDTFLPGMEMDRNLVLKSWASNDDPAEGKFKFQLEHSQYTIRMERSIYWQSRVSGDFMPDDILPIVSSLLSNSNRSGITYNRTKTTSSSFSKNNTRLVMHFDGTVQYFTRLNESAPWNLTWWKPKNRCDKFRACGNYERCSNSENRSTCECLPGFKSNLPDSSRDFSGNCQRTAPLCDGVAKILNFKPLNVNKVEKPDHFPVSSENECKEVCLKDCNCQAYSIETSQVRGVTRKCWIWSYDLYNIQVEDTNGGREIHLRVQPNISPEPKQTKQDGGPNNINNQFKQWPLAFAVTVASVLALAFAVFYIFTRKAKVKKKEDQGSHQPLHFYDEQRQVKELIDSGGLNDEVKKGIDLPFFDFESILAATENFSEANKLGKGGFGPVYKGKFPGGQEIAVKRLSRVSGQGMEEFKNEVVLIARLQHRNLVRLLGYCIEGDEKILLYEFMPNKSLDSFIFDPNPSELLDWEMRFNIIMGIARGLLYLHQDSRLRIIHRDLKTNNILLDEEMNPKISDFGLARIFEGKQTEGATNRVVGTYGYMSPEYALDGFFSVKSDVFSFGVVILEIVSGKKNTGFYKSQEALSFLGYAWRLWQEDKVLDMMDRKLSAGSKTKTNEILKCINVGLLCVQEDPDDRPTMSDVITMLSSVSAALSTPKRPAFIVSRGFNYMAPSSSSSKAEPNNEITITLEGR